MALLTRCLFVVLQQNVVNGHVLLTMYLAVRVSRQPRAMVFVWAVVALWKAIKKYLLNCIVHNIGVHPKKFLLWARSLVFGGSQVSDKGIGVTQKRKQGLIEMGQPETCADLMQLLYAANWIRLHIPEFAKITAPLYAVLNKDLKDNRKKRSAPRQRCAFKTPAGMSCACARGQTFERVLLRRRRSRFLMRRC